VKLQAYLIILVNHEEFVARVARRYMPRLKVQSEVATMQYLREKTNVPVPTVYHYDSNPYNRLGGEFILMSKVRNISVGWHMFFENEAPLQFGFHVLYTCDAFLLGARYPTCKSLPHFIIQRACETREEHCPNNYTPFRSSIFSHWLPLFRAIFTKYSVVGHTDT